MGVVGSRQFANLIILVGFSFEFEERQAGGEQN